MIKSYIWTSVNRFLHYFLIATFCLSYLCLYIEGWIRFHFIFGILFGVGLLLRIIWGIIGTKYSRFTDFNFRGIFGYLFSAFAHKKRYVGHNPASSVATILILTFGLLVCFSGLLQIGAEQNSGIFGSFFFAYSNFQALEGLHTLCANVLLGIVGIHICGGLIDKFWNKLDAIDSMVTGYKITSTQEIITLNPAQKTTFGLFIVFLLALSVYLLYPHNAFLRSPKEIFAQDSNQHWIEYRQECGSCHIVYAPYLLPKSAWDSIMSDLENHFGDDASLEEELHANIAAFLEKYASDFVDTKFAREIGKESPQIAITKYSYWEVAHRGIDSKIFATEAIKSEANCQTCHKDAESGIFAKEAIDYLKLKSLKESL